MSLERRHILGAGIAFSGAMLTSSALARNANAAVRNAHDSYVNALIDIFVAISKEGKKLSKSKIRRKMISATLAKKKIFEKAVFENNPDWKAKYMRATRDAAVKQVQRDVFVRCGLL